MVNKTERPATKASSNNAHYIHALMPILFEEPGRIKNDPIHIYFTNYRTNQILARFIDAMTIRESDWCTLSLDGTDAYGSDYMKRYLPTQVNSLYMVEAGSFNKPKRPEFSGDGIHYFTFGDLLVIFHLDGSTLTTDRIPDSVNTELLKVANGNTLADNFWSALVLKSIVGDEDYNSPFNFLDLGDVALNTNVFTKGAKATLTEINKLIDRSYRKLFNGSELYLSDGSFNEKNCHKFPSGVMSVTILNTKTHQASFAYTGDLRIAHFEKQSRLAKLLTKDPVTGSDMAIKILGSTNDIVDKLVPTRARMMTGNMQGNPNIPIREGSITLEPGDGIIGYSDGARLPPITTSSPHIIRISTDRFHRYTHDITSSILGIYGLATQLLLVVLQREQQKKLAIKKSDPTDPLSLLRADEASFFRVMRQE